MVREWPTERSSGDFHHVLDPEGDLPDLDDVVLLSFYRTFVETRTLEDEMLNQSRGRHRRYDRD